jgi:hypothetical protein
MKVKNENGERCLIFDDGGSRGSVKAAIRKTIKNALLILWPNRGRI